MHYVRFETGGRIAYGILTDDGIEEISSTPFLPHEPTGITHSLSDVRLIAPCLPSKIVAIGANYRDHVKEMGREIPEHPMFFFKPSTAVVGPGAAIVWPPECEELHYEGELAVVFGAVARNVERGRWSEVVLGYTCGIDATARDLQKKDLQWGRAKGFDTSAPLGPAIVTEVDPSDLRIQTRVNGQTRQDGRTDQLIFDVPALVEFVTKFVTMLPGDVMMTGTPAGVGALQGGDRIEVEIESVGTLPVSVKGRPA